MVQVAFAVGLGLPCLEAGMAVDQPPLGVIVRQLRLVASAATAVFGVLNNQPLRRFASEGLVL